MRIVLVVCFGLVLTGAELTAQTGLRDRTMAAPQDTRGFAGFETISTLPDSGLRVVGRWAKGSCDAVDVRGSEAYIGNGPSVQVLDITDVSAPALLGEIVTDGFVYDIHVRDSLAFVATGRSLIVLDVSDPSALRIISEVPSAYQVARIALGDSVVFITGEGGVVVAVDVSDPSQPYRRGSCRPVHGFGSTHALAARGRVAYFTDSQLSRLSIIDASNLDSLRVHSLSVDGSPSFCFVKDNLLFIGVSEFGLPNAEILVCDISDPNNPVYRGYVDLGQSPVSAVAADSVTLFAVAKSGEVYGADIADPATPTLTGNYSPAPWELDGGRAIAQAGPRLIVAQHTGACLLDVSRPDSLRKISFYPTGGAAGRMIVRDPVAFVASHQSGLWILDISDSQCPRGISNINVGGSVDDLVITDSLAYVVNSASSNEQDTTEGLWIFGISDLYHPRVLSHFTGVVRHPFGIGGDILSIALFGEMIVMTQSGDTTYDSTIELIDVHDCSRPSSVSTLRSKSRPLRVAVRDSIVYVADRYLDLRVIDVHVPDRPIELADLFSRVQGVTVLDSVAFVYGDSILVVDIARPGRVSVLSIAATGFSPISDVTALGERLYVAGGFQLAAFDVSDPKSVVPLSGQAIPWQLQGVAASGNTVLASGSDQGVLILKDDFATSAGPAADQYPGPTTYRLFQNFPNPFNPATTIRYGLPHHALVSLIIFNVLGQQVAQLVNGEEEAGYHEVKFDGSSLASGVYFYRFQAGSFVQTRKLLLLR